MPRPKNIPAGSEYWKKKWAYQKEVGEDERDKKRSKARSAYDAAGIDRKGKDIDHKTPLAKGGSAGKSNLRLRSKHDNEADNGHVKGEAAGKKRKVRVIFKGK